MLPQKIFENRGLRLATDAFQAMLDHATASEEQYNCQNTLEIFYTNRPPGESQNSKLEGCMGG